MPSSDLTRPADLRAHPEGTGPLRLRIPIYQDFLPPCNNACPAGENIQAWLSFVQAGRYEDAWNKILEDNPFPAIMGRVCYHTCQSACNRAAYDTEVNIHAIERFLGDMAHEKGWKPRKLAPPSGKRVLVIGAGPSGLSAAFHLARMGHEVEIREAGPVAGGMMHFGIPAYRLPREVLALECQRVADMGVKMVFNYKVDDILAEKATGNFDAVFVAVGAHISKKTEIPGSEAGKIIDAISFLRQVDDGNPPKLGRKVVIYGGGNTAMDAARTAKRLGYEPLIVYRRDREHMPAHDFEAQEALEEGVKIHWLRTIKAFEQQELQIEVMDLDAEGKPVPTGRFETLAADAVILALGQDTDTAFLSRAPGIEFKRDGTVVVDKGMMTGEPGVFAGGDMVPSERTVTVAVGHGKKAARYMDAWLRNSSYQKEPKHPIAQAEGLHLWFKTEAPARHEPERNPDSRKADFREIVGGLMEEEARYEAQRCLSCGNCFECDGCYGACPEDAIIKLGPGLRYSFNYDKCTGCGVCFEQCPCHAIEMTNDNLETPSK